MMMLKMIMIDDDCSSWFPQCCRVAKCLPHPSPYLSVVFHPVPFTQLSPPILQVGLGPGCNLSRSGRVTLVCAAHHAEAQPYSDSGRYVPAEGEETAHEVRKEGRNGAHSHMDLLCIYRGVTCLSASTLLSAA